MNEWSTFGLNNSHSPRDRRRVFANVDTSRMSWHDCHAGYSLIAVPFFLSGAVTDAPWFLIGFIAALNGSYAMAFTVSPPGYYSRPVWWLAIFASVIVFIFFTTFELVGAFNGGFPLQDVLVLLITTKLALGQLSFLLRIRREGTIHNTY